MLISGGHMHTKILAKGVFRNLMLERYTCSARIG